MTSLDIPDGKLRISWYTSDTECLGPGRRFALWVQGCRKSCEGCIAPTLRDTAGGRIVSTDELAEEIICSDCEGLSISGGEPFLQADELARLILTVRATRPDIGVIVYTGYFYEDLLQDNDTDKLLNVTDILIDGEYVAAFDDGMAMRGSSNQRVLFLTDRYRPSDLPRRRTNRFIFSGGTMRMIGIPSDGAKALLDTFTKSERRN